jgi:putative ABC transport system permease protein
MELLKGRVFTDQEKPDAPPVVIVNDTMARRFWPNEDPIGKRFTFGDGGPQARWMTIVGVVRDSKRQGLDEVVRMESFFPHALRTTRVMDVVIRTTDDPMAMARTVRETVWSIDKDLPVSRVQSVEAMLGERTAPRRFNLVLFGLFAVVAVVLAGVGIYGVMAYTVTQRTHEIGIRMALGAETRSVLALVVRQGMTLAVVGVVLGLGASFALTRLMRGLLFGVQPSDPVTFAAIALLLTGIALVACYIPALKATNVDPLVALRHE